MTALTTADHGFTGLTGFAADVLNALGDIGVGVLVFLEVLIPPIPSEVILPFAGYLSQAGELNLGWLIVWSTVASLAGALVLYGLGAAIGLERAIRWIAWTASSASPISSAGPTGSTGSGSGRCSSGGSSRACAA